MTYETSIMVIDFNFLKRKLHLLMDISTGQEHTNEDNYRFSK